MSAGSIVWLIYVLQQNNSSEEKFKMGLLNWMFGKRRNPDREILEYVVNTFRWYIREQKKNKESLHDYCMMFELPSHITKKEILDFDKNFPHIVQYSNELNIGPTIPMN